MLTIHFTSNDLARTRLRTTLGPLSETVFVVGLLRGASGSGQRRLRSRMRALHRGLPPGERRPSVAGLPEQDALMCLIDQGPDVDDTALRAAGLTRADAAALMATLWHTTVSPVWEQALTYLSAECESRARTAMSGGIEQLLSTLHSRVRWTAPVLEVDGLPDGHVHLDGRGLLLAPSVFLADRPAALVRSDPASDLPALAFAAAPDAAGTPAGTGECAPKALGALIGHTRAAALRELTAPCTTSQLAERLGISTAGASQHTSVLRSSGLISTRRVRNSVLHTVTSLGMVMLGAEPVGAQAPGPPGPTVRSPVHTGPGGAQLAVHDR